MGAMNGEGRLILSREAYVDHQLDLYWREASKPALQQGTFHNCENRSVVRPCA